MLKQRGGVFGRNPKFNSVSAPNLQGPAFSAYMLNGSANQSLSSSVFTKVKIDTEEFDTAGCFDTTLNRFTPNVAGYYQINASLYYGSSTAAARGMAVLYKNGAAIKRLGDHLDDGYSAGGNTLVYMNGTTDYLEFYAFVTATTPLVEYGQSITYFNGSLVRSA